ncbi:catalase [Amycolatopsis magusensis]|uniref:Catalase n=1 Tax=Amycolatopsis magusensis TaxID=882444 RepID=A0ABS4PKB5_9PSEU|nr:catalase [Amycolatopsis magusensis]MBP2179330.1 catalase [Amycolatopsis magusensis]MDI5978389.1 catalase [Amycolatopsis magusensis]
MTQPTTNNVGIPVASDNDSLTLGANGPILLQDHYLIEKNAQFNRERVPERVVHAKGGGAFGFLEVTEDVSQFTKAALFQPGTRTESVIRFSSVAGENGSPDTWRDPRGFAVKFYTSQGNYDLVGNNTPVFFIRDPIKFPDFIHSQKRRADNHLRDHNIQWDFWTLRPESAHQVTWLMGDRGIPSNWREMNGYGSHTYLWENAGGEKFWVKYHFKTDQGIGYLTQADADRIAGVDSDFYIRDLFKNIEKGNHPSWTLHVQVMPYADAADYRFNPFDLTKVWPQGDYPLLKVGRYVLDRNPSNYFAEIEQAAFEPSNLVPGIGPSPDKMLQGRLFAYPDAHRYRIGANYTQLPVNAPKSPVHSYSRDGQMRFNNPGDPVYAPNSFGGPHADASETASAYGVEDEVIRSAYKLHAEDDDFGQPGTLVREVMDDEQRDRLASNIIGHASNDVSQPVLERVFEYWRNVDKNLGDKVAAAFGK